MENNEKNQKEYYVIDVRHILKTLLGRAWLIVICGILAAAIGFSVAAFAIAPTYSSSVKLYVNNNSISLEQITIGDINASRGLVDTYGVILGSRTTLERVIQKTGVGYSWEELEKMIRYTPVNDTEIMQVTVTTEDPYEASRIANTIAEVLPKRISEIIEGASMEVVDSAVPDLRKVAPSITRYTAVGMMLGVLLCAGSIVIFAMSDDTIHDEEYILSTYSYPILGKVPDLVNVGGKPYGKRYGSYGYYYKKRRGNSYYMNHEYQAAHSKAAASNADNNKQGG